MLNKFQGEIAKMIGYPGTDSLGPSRKHVAETVPVTSWDNGHVGGSTNSHGRGHNEQTIQATEVSLCIHNS